MRAIIRAMATLGYNEECHPFLIHIRRIPQGGIRGQACPMAIAFF
jgi:hypothetical protein